MWFDEVDVLSNGNVVVLARDQNSDPVGAPIMRIFNSSGTQLSSGTKNQGNSNRILYAYNYYDTLVIDSTDNIIWMQSNAAANKEYFLVKYDSSGNFINEKRLPKYNSHPRNIDIRANPEGTDDVISIATYALPNGIYGIDGLYYRNTAAIGKFSNNAAPVTSTPGYAEITLSINSKPTSAVFVCPSYSSSEVVVKLPNGDKSFDYIPGMNIYAADNCIKMYGDPGTVNASSTLKFYAVQDNVTDGNKDVTVSFTTQSYDTNWHGLTLTM